MGGEPLVVDACQCRGRLSMARLGEMRSRPAGRRAEELTEAEARARAGGQREQVSRRSTQSARPVHLQLFQSSSPHRRSAGPLAVQRRVEARNGGSTRRRGSSYFTLSPGDSALALRAYQPLVVPFKQPSPSLVQSTRRRGDGARREDVEVQLRRQRMRRSSGSTNMLKQTTGIARNHQTAL